MDTSEVILSTIKATIKDMGLPAKTDEECRAIIGIRTDEAGCRTCAVTYGNGSIDSLEAAQPDYIIDDFKTILSDSTTDTRQALSYHMIIKNNLLWNS